MGSVQQVCLDSDIQITPTPALMSEQLDFFGNRTTWFTVEQPHTELTVKATSLVEVLPTTAPDPAQTQSWEAVRDLLKHDASPEGLEAQQFVFDSPYTHASPELAAYALPSFPPGRPLLEGAMDLMHRIHAEFRYDPKATSVNTPVLDILEFRSGVCQDFAHLQIGCLRSLGLAARYVSGYLAPRSDPGRNRWMVGADASHAWLALYCPEIGWVDLDPTNDQTPTDKHVLVAWGRDYDDVSPIKGVNLGGGKHTVDVAVEMVVAGE
jgi:transglutaminase-like putative cysteine protease